MKMLEKRILLVVLAAALPLLVGGCERHSKSEQYFLIATNIGLPYWQSAHAGFSRAAALYGVTEDMRGPDAFTPAVEVDEFRAAVARKPAGILVSVSDPSLMGPEINKAIGAGIPVITIDSDAPDSQRLYFIGTNNLQAGRLGGQRLVQKLDGKGTVVFFTINGQLNIAERLKGYKDVLADHPGIKIADVVDMHGDSGEAQDKTVEYLARKGADTVNAFVCLEASAGMGVKDGIQRAGAKDRLVVAMDADLDTLQAVHDGII